MTSSLNGETINIPVADIHFNECDALKPLGESDDITSDYFNDFIASAAADELEVEFASGDSDIYVTQNIKLPKRIVSYPTAKIEWTSMCMRSACRKKFSLLDLKIGESQLGYSYPPGNH